MEKHVIRGTVKLRSSADRASSIRAVGFARFTWNVEGYRDALVCFELLRAVRVPGVPRAAKKEPKKKRIVR